MVMLIGDLSELLAFGDDPSPFLLVLVLFCIFKDYYVYFGTCLVLIVNIDSCTDFTRSWGDSFCIFYLFPSFCYAICVYIPYNGFGLSLPTSGLK